MEERVKDKTDEHDASLHRQSGWPSGLRLQTYGSGGLGSNPTGPQMKFLKIFFLNWRQNFSKSQTKLDT